MTLTTPDMIVSDGAIERARDEAGRWGKSVVLAPALRLLKEPFFEAYTSNAPRALTRAALASLHSETLRYEWEGPHLTVAAPAAWWRAPGGIVLHCMSWAPLLLDYGALKTHNTRAIDNHTIDGSYVYDNWGDPGDDLRAFTDSDEAFVASWSARGECDHDLTPHPLASDPPALELVKMAALRSLWRSGYDPLKRRLFKLPVRWHGKAIDDKAWRTVEAKAQRVVARCIG